MPSLPTGLKARVIRFGSDARGATAIEYGLIAVMIAVGIIGSLSLYGSSLEAYFMKIATEVGEV